MTPEEARANAARRQAEARRDAPSEPPADMFMNPQTGQMTSRELMRNALPTSQGGAFASGFSQGYALDTLDEAMGAMGGDFMREKTRAQAEANAQDYPVTETIGRVSGAVLSPVNKVMGPVNTLKKAVVVGGLYGGVEGFFSGEGGATARLENAGWNASMGALFSGLTSSLAKASNKVVRATFQRADKRPTVDALKAAKNVAYADVRKSGVKFDENELLALTQRLDRKAKTIRFELDPELPDDKAAISFMDSLKRRMDAGDMSLNKLDQYRQKAWDRFGRTDNPFFLEIVDEIDETISRAAEGNELMRVARAANSKYKKAEMLEDAFRKANRQTAATGSGGNVLNKYRQAIVSILENPKKSKWFSAEEQALMDHFVMGDNAENALRRIGKLSPGGNGLMTALNVYAAAVEPSMLAVTAGATVAKQSADSSAMRGAEAIQDAVATGVIAPPQSGPNLKPFAVGGAAAGNELREKY